MDTGPLGGPRRRGRRRRGPSVRIVRAPPSHSAIGRAASSWSAGRGLPGSRCVATRDGGLEDAREGERGRRGRGGACAERAGDVGGSVSVLAARIDEPRSRAPPCRLVSGRRESVDRWHRSGRTPRSGVERRHPPRAPRRNASRVSTRSSPLRARGVRVEPGRKRAKMRRRPCGGRRACRRSRAGSARLKPRDGVGRLLQRAADLERLRGRRPAASRGSGACTSRLRAKLRLRRPRGRKPSSWAIFGDAGELRARSFGNFCAVDETPTGPHIPRHEGAGEDEGGVGRTSGAAPVDGASSTRSLEGDDEGITRPFGLPPRPRIFSDQPCGRARAVRGGRRSEAARAGAGPILPDGVQGIPVEAARGRGPSPVPGAASGRRGLWRRGS